MKPNHLAALIVLIAALAPPLCATGGTPPKKEEKTKLQPYILPDCIVSDRKLEDDALTFKYEGREIRTCCDMCMDDFFQDPERWVAKIIEAEENAAKAAKSGKKPGT